MRNLFLDLDDIIIYKIELTFSRVEAFVRGITFASCESTLTPLLSSLFPRLMRNNARSGAKRVLRRNKKISDCVLLGKNQ